MATSAHNISSFVDKLLAPLPDSEEQAATPKFMRQVENDITMPWRKGMEHYELAAARHTVSALEKRLGFTTSEEPGLKTYRALINAERVQCLIPAPTAKELRWKLRQDSRMLQEPEVQAVIAEDRKRFGVKEA